MVCRGDKNVLKSKLKFVKPPSGSNLAREVVKGLKENKDKILLIDGQTKIRGALLEYSGDLLLRETNKIASGLIKSELKLENGEPVMFMCEPSMRQTLVLLGSLCAGATVMASSAMVTDAQLRSFAEHVKPRIIFVDADNFHAAKQLRSVGVGLADSKIVLLESLLYAEIAAEVDGASIYSGDKTLFNWTEIDEKLVMERVNGAINGNKQASYLIMNPSTKSPKPEIVPWTHKMLLNDIWKFNSATKASPAEKLTTKKVVNSDQPQQQPGVAHAKNSAAKENGTNLPLIPLDTETSILTGDFKRCYLHCTTSLLWALMNGCRFVVIDALKEHHFWREVAKYRVTAFIGTATFTYRLLDRLITWLERPPRSGMPDISSMRFMACTVSKLNIGELLQMLQPLYPNLRVTQFYGNVESGFVTMQLMEDSNKNFTPIGHLLPGVKARIGEHVDSKSAKKSETSAVASKLEDELLIKTPSLFKHYLPLANEDAKLREKKSVKINKKGYFNTGELVNCDDEQRIHFLAPYKSKHRNSTIKSARSVTSSPSDTSTRIETLGGRSGTRQYTIYETREEQVLPPGASVN